ncbi:MAG: ClbS/DfsB family four-helix bundle protein, partial [Chloroflexota bacterium]
MVDKETLLERIRTSRRQLERYLFYFEKDEEGGFVASKRPKFGEEEMAQPGVAGDWTVCDLLAHLIDREERLLPWLGAAGENKTPDTQLPYLGLPHPTPHIEPAHTDTPAVLNARSIDELLTEFQHSHQRLEEILAMVPEHVLFSTGYFPGTNEATLAQATAAATYEPYEWARDRLRRWRKTHPTRYLNKGKILARIRTERRRLEQNLELLDEAQMLRPGVVGDWSVKDILAHLADWECRFLGWYRAGQRGEVPETPAPDLSWSQL